MFAGGSDDEEEDEEEDGAEGHLPGLAHDSN